MIPFAGHADGGGHLSAHSPASGGTFINKSPGWPGPRPLRLLTAQPGLPAPGPGACGNRVLSFLRGLQGPSLASPPLRAERGRGSRRGPGGPAWDVRGHGPVVWESVSPLGCVVSGDADGPASGRHPCAEGGALSAGCRGPARPQAPWPTTGRREGGDRPADVNVPGGVTAESPHQCSSEPDVSRDSAFPCPASLGLAGCYG